MVFDLAVIGGGIVGMATALRYQARNPTHSIVVLEKEAAVACHQSGHNSGVIHAGVYYAPGSLKARLCRKGALQMKEFCNAHDVPYEQLGKMIVATKDIEVARLGELRQRAIANGIPFEDIDQTELARREPYISGLAALFFPESAIVDYGRVTRRMAEILIANGGEVRLNARVQRITETAEMVALTVTDGATVQARHLVVCGGAQADRLARLAGLRCNFRVVPFRGEYYQLDPAVRTKVRHLIYPVPDPDLPFLGIHLTHEPDGQISVGPNAVLGLSREGLPQFSLNLRDIIDTLTYAGFWRFLRGNLVSGLAEIRNSLIASAYLTACRTYMPSLQRQDLRGRKAGVRAQIIMDDGAIMHDFLILKTQRMTHLCCAPSPAATSSLAIADHILDEQESDMRAA